MQRPSHRYFAENLRRECSRFKSIAEVCRGTGVNRQQFNKYLSGKYLPNQRTRKRICQFLKVPEEELFRPPHNAQSGNGRLRPKDRVWTKEALGAIATAANKFFPNGSNQSPATIHDGYYFCYFPMQRQSEMLVRSLLKVSTHGSVTTFVRHTYFNMPSFGVGFVSRGRHRGLVMGWGSEVYFMALNSHDPLHVSLMVFSDDSALSGVMENDSKSVLVGLALTRGLSAPYSCRVCLEYLGSDLGAVRNRIQQVGLVRFSDASIKPLVSATMSPFGNALVSQMDFPILEQIITPAPSARRAGKKE